jgi:endonuclease/exonuclease/phosphatase family metal-dependent hydrolase
MDPRCDGRSASKSFLTYNGATGAHGMVSMANLREPSVIEGLRETDFDVACLQEVWTPAHAAHVRDGLGLTPAQSFYFDTTGMRESGKDVCSDAQLAVVAKCAEKECGKVTETDEVSICVRKECGGALASVYASADGAACVNCLVATAGRSIDSIRSICGGDGASRIQDGGSSAMLIAKSGRLYDKEPLLLPSSGSNRTALFATVRMSDGRDGEQEVEVVCTHISASAKIAPAHSGYATWDEEKIAQLQLITSRLSERSLRKDGARVPMVLLGDFNSGPDSSLKVWQAVIDAGFTCPTADPVTGGGCTSCGDNTLVGGHKEEMIDHICYLNPSADVALVPTCTDRLFDETVEITGYGGEAGVVTHPSDHYAKRTLFDLVLPGSLRAR